uniref:Uncharacterized protein n=1 Tax=Glossina brevipalpis TaxID=37001 RepID=A0A1A9W325_9MUSC
MPALPNIVLKAITFVCFAGSVVMESTTFAVIASVSESYCIIGHHVTDAIGLHLLLLRIIYIPDCIYMICLLASLPFNSCSFGAEPTTIVYNIIAGLFAQISLSKIPTMEDCGNDAMATILSVPSANGSLIGILHFVSAAVCIIFLPVVERSVFNSSCIEGMEVTEEVGHHLLLLCMITIPDFVYAVTVFLAIPIRDCNFGSELTSIGYNIVSGMIAYSSLSKITMIENCGNEAMEVILFQPAASVSLSGTLHYANAFINFIFLAKAERSFYIMRTSDSNPDVFLQY